MPTEYTLFIINIVISSLVAAGTALFTIGQYKARVDRLMSDQKDCDTKRTDMKTELDKLLEFKTQAQKFIDAQIYNKKSPLTLTDLGKKLVTESGLDGIFETVKDDLAQQLEAFGPTTQYDVQEDARALMDSLTDYAPFQSIKQYAFENGQDLGQILRAGAIMLRDYYFEQHPEVVNPAEKW